MFFIFYFLIFCILIIISTYFVLVSSSPIQSILFLILSFVFSCFLFIILGVEFLGIVLLAVYVGAISILFLFIVMMFNLRTVELYFDFFRHLPVGGFIGIFCVFNFLLNLMCDFGFFSSDFILNIDGFFFWHIFLFWKNNILNLSFILYNFYFLYIFLASLILFTAMLGVIILTVDFEYRIIKKSSLFRKSNGSLVQNLNLDDNVRGWLFF